jgi:hypothetical protein
VGADVAAAFNPETPRQFILPENESVLARKSQILKSLCCVHLHTASQNAAAFFIFLLLHRAFW